MTTTDTPDAVDATVGPREFSVEREGGVTLVGEVWEPTDGPGGDAEPVDEILMLHGGAQTRHSWSRAARRLSAEGYRVTAMDARGHGDSDWDPEGDYDIHRMSEDLEAIVAECFPGRRPVIVGASLGGLTAMLAMGTGKDVARALVLVDVTPKIEAEGVERIGKFMRSGFDGFASLEEAAEMISAYQPHRKRPTNLDGLRKNLRIREDGRWHWHWDPRFAGGASAANAEIGNAFFEDLVPAIRQPTMLIRGSASDIVSDESVRHLLELLPHAHTMEVADAGHMVAGDDNAVFLDQLEWFLTEVIGSPPRSGEAGE
jgi:non-heme chloroperoxidase